MVTSIYKGLKIASQFEVIGSCLETQLPTLPVHIYVATPLLAVLTCAMLANWLPSLELQEQFR